MIFLPSDECTQYNTKTTCLGLWHTKSRDAKIIFKRIWYPSKKDIVVVVLRRENIRILVDFSALILLFSIVVILNYYM